MNGKLSLENRSQNFYKKVEKKFNGTWEILSEYKSSQEKMKFKCKKCNIEIFQTPKVLLNKKGCQNCYFCSMILTTDIFIEKAKLIHNENFNYDKVDYVRSDEKVIIFCKSHNIEFLQEPRHHLEGHGCSECRIKKIIVANSKNKEDFVNLAQSIHNINYNYDKVNYINNDKKVEILCLSCNKYFFQLPRIHISGHGCSFCPNTISKAEINWLNYLNVPEEFRQKTIEINNKNYKVDALNEKEKIIYEFYGDFWHGNPEKFNSNDINVMSKKTFGVLYNKTLNRQKELENAGYKIIFIWENDFNKILKTIK